MSIELWLAIAPAAPALFAFARRLPNAVVALVALHGTKGDDRVEIARALSRANRRN